LGPKQQNLKKPLLGGYPKEPEFQNYEVHQVGPKDYGSQNFSLQRQRRVTDGFFFIAQIMLFSQKKS
jgi:hypothetical protein